MILVDKKNCKQKEFQYTNFSTNFQQAFHEYFQKYHNKILPKYVRK